MGFTESSGYCAYCQRQVLARQQTPNHILHCLITLFSCGAWAIVWLLITLFSSNPVLCTVCGRPTTTHQKSTSAVPVFTGIAIAVVVLAAVVVLSVLMTGSRSTANKEVTQTLPYENKVKENKEPQPGPASNQTTSTRDLQADYKRGFQAGLDYGRLQGNHPEEGGMPLQEGLELMARGFATLPNGEMESARWQQGWIDGFKKGFSSIRGPGRNEAEFETLTINNAVGGLKLYNNDGSHVATIISADPASDLMTVRYVNGTVEPKKISALSRVWFVRKDDPALNQ